MKRIQWPCALHGAKNDCAQKNAQHRIGTKTSPNFPIENRRGFFAAYAAAGLVLLAGAGCAHNGVRQNPGAETDAWAHSMTLGLDTTADGANVPGDVENYPLAVLLNGDNFDFGQAHENGRDIRFFNSEGDPLKHSVEDWDRAAEYAAVWVMLPLVKGDDNTQSIVMKWGHPSAPDAGDSRAVFNEDAGFLAVFHLNEDGNTDPEGYRDSSWNEVHGTGQAMEPGSRVDGRIGKGTLFRNPEGTAGENIRWIRTDSPKVEEGFNATDERFITASAWALADGFDGYYETIFSKGDRSWTLQRDWQKAMEVCALAQDEAGERRYHACAIADLEDYPPIPGVWIHYMITIRPGHMALYMDGELVATQGGSFLSGDHDFAIANQAQYAHRPQERRGWNGIIDEVRVMTGEKTADWAKLDYESQREDQTLLSFNPGNAER